MRWNLVNDIDYLVQLTDAPSNGRFLGLSYELDEQIHDRFQAGK
jgi:hypothetical protein